MATEDIGVDRIAAIKAEFQRLSSAVRAVRDRIHVKRPHAALMRVPDRYNTVCSAMDVVEDTVQALHAWTTRTPAEQDDNADAYLTAYGVLHALYLQQDAVFWLCKCLGLQAMAQYRKPGKWAMEVPELKRARTARNDSTGHPVRRDMSGSLASFFISQHSLSGDGFQLIEVREAGPAQLRHVSFAALIADQIPTLATFLEQAAASLDEEARRHYKRFMNKPLTPILAKLSYPMEKLGSRNDHDGAMLSFGIDGVRRGLDTLERAINERKEPFDEQWQWEYKKLHCALDGLADHEKSTAKCDDDLADVLGDYVRYAIKHLQELTAEIDQRYAAGSNDA